MCEWRGAKPLSRQTFVILSGFGLSSGLALTLALVLKVVHLRGYPVPLAKPSPIKDGSRRTTHQMSNDPTNREENMSRKPDPLTKHASEAEKPPRLTPKFLISPISAHSPSK